ncbi:MAG: hypothetical protein IT453_19600 [Planctomycetes bacterium]|nr:hypothetical protein [Planctomycetota bacterium]
MNAEQPNEQQRPEPNEAAQDGEPRDRRELLRRLALTNFVFLFGGTRLARAFNDKSCEWYDCGLDFPPPHDGCGKYNENGVLLIDAECNYQQSPGDYDCAMPLSFSAQLEVSSDDDCASFTPEGKSNTDSDCGMVSGSKDGFTTYHGDSLCGRVPGKDADCDKWGADGRVMPDGSI